MAGAEVCVHCGESLKKNAFGLGNESLPQNHVEAWNAAYDEQRQGACKRCVTEPMASVATALDNKERGIQQKIVNLIRGIALLSLHQPEGWRYRSIGLVTAQSTTGTGPLSELTTAWTDFFGKQSKVYNNKIRAGEDLCAASLRLQSVLSGGNAVLGVDVDYAEVGGQRAMLMVCMTGTAVEILNEPDVMPGVESIADQVRALHVEASRLNDIRGRLTWM